MAAVQDIYYHAPPIPTEPIVRTSYTTPNPLIAPLSRHVHRRNDADAGSQDVVGRPDNHWALWQCGLKLQMRLRRPFHNLTTFKGEFHVTRLPPPDPSTFQSSRGGALATESSTGE